MISGFGSSARGTSVLHAHHTGNGGLPIPFNIPIVLHNLLFEETGIEYDAKQKDILETIVFSFHSLERMNQKYGPKEQELKSKLFHDPDNEKLKEEMEELRLDFFEANHHFKDLVIVISDMLTRDQYTQLLEFSNIPT